MEKYGVPNATQNPEIMEKVHKTNIERYGFKVARMNEDINKKLEQTNIERYGAPCIFSMDGFRDKVKENMAEKYGSLEAFYAYVYDCAIEGLAKHRKNGGKTEIEQLTYEYLVDVFGNHFDLLFF